MDKNQKFSLREGTLSLLCVGLFFIGQIINMEASIGEAQAASEVVPAAATLRVEMLKTSVTEIAKGSEDVVLVAAKFSNPGTQDLTLAQVYISGVFSAANETNTDLYFDQARGGEPDLVQDNAVGYTGLSWKIPAGQSVTLTLRGDIPATNAKSPLTYYFTGNILARDIAGNRAHVDLVGNAGASLLHISEPGAVSNSSFNIHLVAADLSAEKGDKNVVLQKMILKNDLKTTGVIRINSFDVVSSGSYLGDTNLDAAYLFLGDKLFALGQVKEGKIVFDSVVALSAGTSNVLTLKGDIAERATARTLVCKMNWEYNVYYGGVTIHTPINLTGSPVTVNLKQTAISPAIDYDIAGSFTRADFPYVAGANRIFSQVARDGEVYQAKLDGDEDRTFQRTDRYCGYDQQSHGYPDGWYMERKQVATDKYRILVAGYSKPDCGLGQPQNTGWFKLNPTSNWKITEAVKCNIMADNDSNGQVIETYCTVNRDTGEVKWQSGSLCGGCCACGDGALVDIEVVVEKKAADTDGDETDEKEPVAKPGDSKCQDGGIDIKDGALIRLQGSIDVYIAKKAGCKRFKRLILSPSVFRSYGHLKWADIIEVDQATFDSYTTSNYVRVLRENAVWQLEAQGDNGMRKKLMKMYRWDEATSGWNYNFDPDGVYEINEVDRDSYLQGPDILE